ncbi:MAG: hypothetical protein ACM3ZF_12845, partial [Mycobacterium leprae]
RPQYEAAAEDMLERTDHDAAPWHLVEAEDKRHARVKVVETFCEQIEEAMAARGLLIPPRSEVTRAHRW